MQVVLVFFLQHLISQIYLSMYLPQQHQPKLPNTFPQECNLFLMHSSYKLVVGYLISYFQMFSSLQQPYHIFLSNCMDLQRLFLLSYCHQQLGFLQVNPRTFDFYQACLEQVGRFSLQGYQMLDLDLQEHYFECFSQ